VAHGDAVLCEKKLDIGGQLQEAQHVSDGGSVFSGAAGDVFVAQLVLSMEAVEGLGDFDGIKIFALDVFDQADFKEVVVGGVLDDDGNFAQPGEAGGSPAAFTSDDFVAFADLTDDQRLDDSVGFDGLGELTEAVWLKDGPRLEGVGINAVDG
jgi:hypothetical protein